MKGEFFRASGRRFAGSTGQKKEQGEQQKEFRTLFAAADGVSGRAADHLFRHKAPERGAEEHEERRADAGNPEEEPPRRNGKEHRRNKGRIRIDLEPDAAESVGAGVTAGGDVKEQSAASGQERQAEGGGQEFRRKREAGGRLESEQGEDGGDSHRTGPAVAHDFELALPGAAGEEAVRGVGGAIQVKPFGQRLRKEGELKGLILDYRSNGGGIMQEAVKILGMFVPKGTEVVSTKGRSEDSKQVFRTNTEPVLPDLPLVVLVNGSSASAAEIVAGALQDLDRAVLIGQRSFGKGLVQTTRPLGYNTMLKLTTAKYYIPSGRCIQAIDYSHSQEGDIRTVPDSLISEFSTRAGRKVYDGGGIMPDIRTEPEYISRFAMTLYAMGFIEDFGDEYTRRNPGKTIDIRTFSISDQDYADFAEFMKDKKVPYESDTRRALKALKKAADEDLFADLKEKFEKVEAELKDDTRTNLETYREQVIETINNDIVMRHGYQAGVIEHSLPEDTEVQRAIGILNNPQEYKRITTEQDTARK